MSMIMFTRFSQRIFDGMRFVGLHDCIYASTKIKCELTRKNIFQRNVDKKIYALKNK